MKRDMDLVRKILMACEACEHGRMAKHPEIEGFSEEQILYHAHLMLDAGLITGFPITTSGSPSPEAVPTGLTWEGHDFLDASKDEGRWQKTRQAAGSVAMGALKAILNALAIEAAKMKLGIH